MEAHRRGVLHQAVSVFVFSGDELLIQQRAAEKYHCGSLWANSCCTHPYWGEDLRHAADRRVREELGITVNLTAARALTYQASVTDGLFEHEHVQVFWAETDRSSLSANPDRHEVQGLRWDPPRRLGEEARADPERFAPWFRVYLARWLELGLPGAVP